MNFEKYNLKEIFNLFNIESKNFKIKPSISSFDEFKELYELDKKLYINHVDCNSEFNLSLKEWIILSDINTNDNNTLFKCVDCINNKHLKFSNSRLKNKFFKFQEFKEYFNIIPSIDCLEDYRKIIESNINIKIKHKFCNNITIISLNEWQLLDSKNKHLNDHNHSSLCLKCLEDKKSKHAGWKWNNKYNRFKVVSEGFEISPNISNAKEYEHMYDKEVIITHKTCNRSFTIILKKWMNLHTLNRAVIDENKSHLCIPCSQEKKNILYQEHLDKEYNKEFILTSDFIGSKHPVFLKHNVCYGTFDVIPDNYRKNPITCKHCGKKSSDFEKNEVKKMNKKLELYLTEHNLTNFIPLSNSSGVSKPMKFKSKICGHEFERTARSLIPFAGKDYCPECIDLRHKSENQDDRNDYFQSKLDEAHGSNVYTLVSNYTKQNTYVEVIHNKCKNKIDVYSETIRKKQYKCPYCESNNLKYSNHITLSHKMKLYEKETNNRYIILTPFVHLREKIKVKHVECGNTFITTGNTLKKSKNHEICPACKKKARLNQALKALEKHYGDDYILLNPEDFSSRTKPLKFKHKCGAIVEKTFSRLLQNKGNHCDNCSNHINTTTKLKNYTFKRYKGEYIVLGEYIKSNQPVKFRHKKCGKTFKLSSKDFQNRKVPRPYCSKEQTALTKKEVQQRADEKFGKLFKVCGEYKNSKTEIIIMCNNCSHIFSDKLPTFLSKTKCPYCKKKHL